MKKKTLAFLLATICLLSFTVAAFAAPSKTTQDLTSTGTTTSSSSQSTPSLQVAIVSNTAGVTSDIQGLQAAGGAVSYFGDAAVAEIAAKLPNGVTVNDLEINEFVTSSVSAYTAGIGAVSVSFTFATQYKNGQALVAVVSVYDAAGNATRYVLSAKVQNGVVLVTFPEDVLKALNGQTFGLAILSAK